MSVGDIPLYINVWLNTGSSDFFTTGVRSLDDLVVLEDIGRRVVCTKQEGRVPLLGERRPLQVATIARSVCVFVSYCSVKLIVPYFLGIFVLLMSCKCCVIDI